MRRAPQHRIRCSRCVHSIRRRAELPHPRSVCVDRVAHSRPLFSLQKMYNTGGQCGCRANGGPLGCWRNHPLSISNSAGDSGFRGPRPPFTQRYLINRIYRRLRHARPRPVDPQSMATATGMRMVCGGVYLRVIAAQLLQEGVVLTCHVISALRAQAVMRRSDPSRLRACLPTRGARCLVSLYQLDLHFADAVFATEGGVDRLAASASGCVPHIRRLRLRRLRAPPSTAWAISYIAGLVKA